MGIEIIRKRDKTVIYTAAAYAALDDKTNNVGIIYGTAAAPTPTGYPDGCIYIQHAA
jgi:hypothetical protein